MFSASLNMSLSLDWLPVGVSVIAVLIFIYLAWVNHILQGVPSEVRKLSGPRWTAEQLKRVYRALDEQPIDYTSKLPPRLDRRYIVTGGNGERGSNSVR